MYTVAAAAIHLPLTVKDIALALRRASGIRTVSLYFF